MKFVKMVIENWVYFFCLIVLATIAVYTLLAFLKLTPKQQMKKLQVALLYMVTEAEKEMGSETGRVKRSMVWEWLVKRFPVITLFLTEEKYDELLEQALAEFRKLLESNEKLYDYVYDTITITKEEAETGVRRKTTGE